MKPLTAALIVLPFLVPPAPATVLAQGTGSTSGEVRDLLLRPAGWVFEWKPAGTDTKYGDPSRDTGTAELIFEARGDSITLKINNITHPVTCEKEAKLSGDTVTFDMCISGGVTLRFDPADLEYRFKGGAAGFDDRMKTR